MKVEIYEVAEQITVKSDEVDLDILKNKDVVKYAGMLLGTILNLKDIKELVKKIKEAKK